MFIVNENPIFFGVDCFLEIFSCSVCFLTKIKGFVTPVRVDPNFFLNS